VTGKGKKKGMIQWLFGAPGPKPDQVLKRCREQVRCGRSDLEREISRLTREDSQVQLEIKALAKRNQMVAVRAAAKRLVRNRAAVGKCYEMTTQLADLDSRLQTLSTVATMQDAMRGAARAMHIMNRSVSLPALRTIMMTFMKEGAMLDQKMDVMDDTLDEVMGAVDDDSAQEEVVNRVLDELGIKMTADMADVPAVDRVREQQQASASLESKIDALRK
jgi:charged multivesicular body protein 2A